MKVVYDKYYQTENLFGNPYPELISFLSNYSPKGTLLDLGCGQGRDAIPLAHIGYEVTGVDISAVGIAQMNKVAQIKSLSLTGVVADIYVYSHFSDFEIILLDSMFHFSKKDLKKETDFIKTIIHQSGSGTLIIFCIPNTSKKIKVLNNTIDFERKLERIKEVDFHYEYKDDQTGHISKTAYKMIVVKK